MNCLQRSYDVLSLCHEKTEKKRCPYCESLFTKRKGYFSSTVNTKRGLITKKTQRYFCNSCQKSFCSNKPGKRMCSSLTLKNLAVNEYISTKSSLSEVGIRYGVHASTVHRWMISQVKETKIYGRANVDDFSGYLCFDGKVLKVGGLKRTLLWACDPITGKLICYSFSEREDSKATYKLLELLLAILPKDVKYVTTDFGRGKCFLKPVNKIFSKALHQICIVHFLRYVNFQLPKTRRSEYFWRNMIFRTTVKAIVRANSIEEAKALLDRLLNLESAFPTTYHKRLLKSLEKNLNLLLAYRIDDKIPSTSNRIEAWNRKLERKLKNMDGFQNDETCKVFLELWFNKNSKYGVS